MADLKLSKLPDRTPIKVTISMGPGLYQRLQDYARAYSDAYHVEEPVTELLPAMITAFLDSDREFARRRR